MEETTEQKTDNKPNDFILSDERETNSYGFRVELSGGQFDRFRKNPVMLLEHDTNKVIGRWENIRISPPTLIATAVFDEKDELGGNTSRKVRDGFLKGVSMGIRPIEMKYIGDELVATEWELMEASITSIPSDAGAVRLYDESRQVQTLDQIKLKFNLNNSKMDNKSNVQPNEVIRLSEECRKSLGLQENEGTPLDIELAVRKKDEEIKKLQADKVDQFLLSALQSGKIITEEKEHFAKLAATDFDTVKSLIDGRSAKASVQLSDVVKNQQSGDGNREGWTRLKWMKEDSEGLLAMKHNNPEQYKNLK